MAHKVLLLVTLHRRLQTKSAGIYVNNLQWVNIMSFQHRPMDQQTDETSTEISFFSLFGTTLNQLPDILVTLVSSLKLKAKAMHLHANHATLQWKKKA